MNYALFCALFLLFAVAVEDGFGALGGEVEAGGGRVYYFFYTFAPGHPGRFALQIFYTPYYFFQHIPAGYAQRVDADAAAFYGRYDFCGLFRAYPELGARHIYYRPVYLRRFQRCGGPAYHYLICLPQASVSLVGAFILSSFRAHRYVSVKLTINFSGC